MEEESGKAVVVNLIERAVESTTAEVDPRLLKAIKFTVRYSDSELRFAAETLMSFMKRDHSQVRYLALLIIDQLFMRSKLFRNLLIENLDQLLSLSVGFRGTHPLPDPASIASLLRSKAIEFLEKWNESFGIHYRQIRLGYDYLKNTLRFQFPNLQANAARVQQERLEREMRTKEILLKKYESLKENFPFVKEEILAKINEIDECLDIVRLEDDDVPLVPLDDEEMEEFRNSELRQIRLDSLKEGEKVRENSENKVVFDALREFYKVLVTKHLVGIQEWISVLIRVELPDNRFRDSALKDLIDLRNSIQSTKRKCEELGCDLSKSAKAEEDDIWEDGTVEPLEKGKVSPGSSTNNNSQTASTSNSARDNISKNGKNKKSSDPIRSELLNEAPILNWGSFLDNWGSKRDILANQRGLDLEGHWGRVEQDAVIPADKIAELNVHTSVYKEKPVEIPPCRAPLKKGGLCQRRDLKVCPFHGQIIPRDDEGKPVNENPVMNENTRNRSEESDHNMDNELVGRLLKQAMKNVRERDHEEANKRVLDKKALKRAKLAKIRQHNESVLRDAALASTWRSNDVGENMETGSRSRYHGRTSNNKQALASMLRKKESTKVRLAQRLLNTRAGDSTIRQLTQAEETSYREAFPNQW
ncbi:UV-stimulated scaffold protein A homolog [Striga asiatica]|uniref:UV-stimulated scaffold protein A homolog n=1 Tax=Striga asiatica TaxID=4170 RepID=A0A5A7QUU7_STRAF|nr:UV-stimulated scaffold protein A homolog [Striga asiatica]